MEDIHINNAVLEVSVRHLIEIYDQLSLVIQRIMDQIEIKPKAEKNKKTKGYIQPNQSDFVGHTNKNLIRVPEKPLHIIKKARMDRNIE